MYFLAQVKRTNGTVEKGIVVKETYDEVQQSFHAYLGAYAYGKDANTDYVLVHILNEEGLGLKGETWKRTERVEEVEDGNI